MKLGRRRGTSQESENFLIKCLLFGLIFLFMASVTGLIAATFYLDSPQIPSSLEQIAPRLPDDTPERVPPGDLPLPKAPLQIVPNKSNNPTERLISKMRGTRPVRKNSGPKLVALPAAVPDPNWTPPGPDRYLEYKDGTHIVVVTPEVQEESDRLARSRRAAVGAAMAHAWKGYSDHAFGMDEVLPVSGGGRNNWGGMGTTLVDALDTLWLLGLKDEFWKARDWVRDFLKNDHVHKEVSVFETTIRSLGGLLSAYDLSGDEVFLTAAKDLGDRLYTAFEASISGIPVGKVRLDTALNGKRGISAGFRGSMHTNIAEAGTLQIEFRFLSMATGETKYATAAEKVYKLLRPLQEKHNGLLPWGISTANPPQTVGNNEVNFGAMGDSCYEYMLKLWLQGGRKETLYRQMYDDTVDAMHAKLLLKTTDGGLTYIAKMRNGRLIHTMDHLACFMAGTLALGAYTDPQGLESPRAQRDLKTGKALAYTCYQMYARQKTGIGPEMVSLNNGRGMSPQAPQYLLRPEVVESFFILNHLTKDPVYREWGWEIFQAIERFCRTSIAYGGLTNVNHPQQSPVNTMESFFLAETIKYLYLLQDPDNEIDLLNKHLFNTEAHPLRIFDALDGRAPQTQK